MIKKLVLIVCLTTFLNATNESNVTKKESLLKLIVMVGNWMKGTYISDGIMFEESRLENGIVVSSFVIQSSPKASEDEVNFVLQMSEDHELQKSVLDEFAFLNQEKLCANKVAEKWKELDITIEYRFRFAEQQSPFTTRQIKAKQCQLSK